MWTGPYVGIFCCGPWLKSTISWNLIKLCLICMWKIVLLLHYDRNPDSYLSNFTVHYQYHKPVRTVSIHAQFQRNVAFHIRFGFRILYTMCKERVEANIRIISYSINTWEQLNATRNRAVDEKNLKSLSRLAAFSLHHRLINDAIKFNYSVMSQVSDSISSQYSPLWHISILSFHKWLRSRKISYLFELLVKWN